jgi:Helix-turn-helix domain
VSWPHIVAARSHPPAGLTAGARHVLLVVSTYTNERGRAWVSQDTLAADTGYHPASIRRILDALELCTTGLVIPRPGKTSLFNLAPTARRPRAYGAQPRAYGRDEQYGTVKPRAALEGPPGDITARIPPAWHRIADPDLRDDVLQLRWEID